MTEPINPYQSPKNAEPLIKINEISKRNVDIRDSLKPLHTGLNIAFIGIVGLSFSSLFKNTVSFLMLSNWEPSEGIYPVYSVVSFSETLAAILLFLGIGISVLSAIGLRSRIAGSAAVILLLANFFLAHGWSFFWLIGIDTYYLALSSRLLTLLDFAYLTCFAIYLQQAMKVIRSVHSSNWPSTTIILSVLGFLAALLILISNKPDSLINSQEVRVIVFILQTLVLILVSCMVANARSLVFQRLASLPK